MKPSRKKYDPPVRPREPRPLPADIPPKPELLAPAGNLASWAAAVGAGADAVYLGLRGFSARAFADNFSLAELARVVDQSHRRGVKIFLAFNIQAKEVELSEAARLLDALSRIGPDALIVQDLGLFRLIRRYYPDFEVHASTLTAVHNLSGLQVLAGLGYDRAVLARELTLREIRFLAEKSPIPVEIFIHGALCFCFSGLCLMSSYLGGKGSLRGACTQPCRRRYTAGSKRGHYFSPLDLEAVDLMPQIRDLPLAALKIEGRMKGPQYVDPVVRAYRLLLDAPPEDWEKTQAEARALIETSLGRPRCSGFFLGPRAPGALAPHLAATSGRFVGKIIEIEPDGGRLILKEPLTLGDRLRIRSREDESQKAFTLKHLWAGGHDVDQAGAGSEVWIGLPDPPAFGDLVFKVDTAKGEKEALASDLVRVVREAGPAKKEPRPTPAFSKIMAELDNPNPYRPRETRTEIWYRVGRAEDAPGVDDVRPDRIILPVSPANVRKVASGRKRGEWVERLIWSLDPLVFEGDRAGLRKELAQVVRMGGQRFMIANLGHLPLLDLELPGRRGRPIVYADHRLGCLNHQAERLLADLGVSGVTVSLESDGENLSLLLDHPGPVARLAYLYGRPSLFTSRFQPDGLKDGYPVESPREERLRVRNRPGHFEVFAERPIFMAPLLRSPAGFAAFIVDLEHDPRPAATARTVAETIRRGRSLTGTSRFNLTRGLF